MTSGISFLCALLYVHSSLDGRNFMSISASDALESYPDVQRVLVPTHPGRSFDVYNTYDPPAGTEEVSES